MDNNNKSKCLFCCVANDNKEKIIIDGKFVFAIYDDFPVSCYHCLVIPKRHVESFFDLLDEELLEINSLLRQCKIKILAQDSTVRGFNVGINIGEAAGQSIFHVHVHLIPRRTGDVKSPKGGVRGVIPNKQNY